MDNQNQRHICNILLFLCLLDFAAVSFAGRSSGQVNIWPMPKYLEHGYKSLYLSSDFKLKNSVRSKYGDGSAILGDGFSRMVALLRSDHHSGSSFLQSPQSSLLRGIEVVIYSSGDKLQYGVDESYNLSIPIPGMSDCAVLEAGTVYGALHGLQTFSQLCRYSIKTRAIEVGMAPWTIIDQPRFSYRGLLIDTSRHYLPLPVIKNVIDSMTYAKLNILHWHIVDSQSFPLEIPSFPKLWNGAYSTSERYTVADAVEIVSYAQTRGVNVLAEIDVPGHAGSWGVGYPSLWPSANCREPLDVSKEFTFKLLDGIISDLSKVFPFRFIHLGGDEVNTTCWEFTPHVWNWLQKHRMSGADAYKYFVLRAQKIALSHGFEIINWEETFKNFGDQLSSSTVVHNWLDSSVPRQAVASGFRCIVSDQGKWYLDHLDTTWDQFYMYEPLTNIVDHQQQKLIMGGEVCVWGEHIDASDIEQTIWPRAAAAAERLWTPYNKLAKDPREVTARLAHFRCLLTERGIAAAPLAGPGRTAPLDPGSCYSQ